MPRDRGEGRGVGRGDDNVGEEERIIGLEVGRREGSECQCTRKGRRVGRCQELGEEN